MPKRIRSLTAVLIPVLFVAASCSGDDDAADETTAQGTTAEAVASEPATTDVPASEPDPTTTQATTTVVPTTTEAEPAVADAAVLSTLDEELNAGPDGCDPLDPRQCLLPFPSDAYAVDDPNTVTGIRVAIPDHGLPTNVEGVAVDPTEWNRNDGFSPSSTILVHLPELDIDASFPATWTDLGAWMADDAPIVLLDTSTGDRVPLWAEADGVAPSSDEALVVIQPAINLDAATTYAVALRDLTALDGGTLDSSATFSVYRDALETDIAEIEDRRPAMEEMFGALGAAGVDREDLLLAWQFTTASTESTTERMLSIRDRTLAGMDGAAPAFSITEVNDDPEPEGIARSITGTFTTDNWLTGDGGPGNGFELDADGLPTLNGTIDVDFACNVSESTMAGSTPAPMAMYGHGLLGSHDQVNSSYVTVMSIEHGIVFCATKWAGFSEDDLGTAAQALGDLSNFPLIPDRTQQGVLHQLVLGRLMLAADGLVTDPAFQRPDGSPILDNAALHYDGNSQGGIFGTMLAAVSTDIERFVLGVPGINYSVLLPRSVDFQPFLPLMAAAYPSVLEQTLLISAIQMLWDRGEGSGYVRHIVDDPLPGTEPKEVLLHVAFGDWQVTELAAFNQARTMGIPIHRPVTADGRSREVEPGWGIETLDYAVDRSAILVWDSQSAPIPIERVPPSQSRDPHSDPRKDVDVREQKAAFLLDGELIDVCGDGEPCFADPN